MTHKLGAYVLECAALIAAGCSQASASANTHPLSVNDVLHVEGYGDGVFSPEGRSVIIEYIAPYASLPALATMRRSARARLYQIDIQTGVREQLFKPRADEGSNVGAFSPRRVRMIVRQFARGTSSIAVYDFKSKILKRRLVRSNCCAAEPLWINDHEFVAALIPEGSGGIGVGGQTPLMDTVNRLWKKRLEGRDPSVTVNSSSKAGVMSPVNSGGARLVRIDVQSGHTTTLSDGVFEQLALSADGRYLAAQQLLGFEQPEADGGAKPAIPRTDSWVFDLLNRGRERGSCLACKILPARIVPMAPPSPSAVFLDFDARSGQALFEDDGAQESLLELVSARGEVKVLERINAHFHQVIWPRRLVLTYSSGSGVIDSCLILPGGGTPGRRYPLIVSLYPFAPTRANADECEGEQQSLSTFRLDGPAATQHQIFTGFGYAVLLVGTRQRAGLVSAQEIATLAERGADEAIKQGYAQPDNKFLYGYSQGMYEALQAVTASHRFNAAFAGFGIADPASAWGQIPPLLRFLNGQDAGAPQRRRFESTESTNPIPLGALPWEAQQRYLDSSPYFHAGSIRTPVLLMASDLDQFSQEQSAQLFSALYAQRKDAQYVVYWGEGHLPESPANLADLWSRIAAWYARYSVTEKMYLR